VAVTDGNKLNDAPITNSNTTQALLDDLKERGYHLSVGENGNLRTERDDPPITPVIRHALQANYTKLVRLIKPPVTDSNVRTEQNVRKDNTDWSKVADLRPKRGEEMDQVLAEHRAANQAAAAVVEAKAPENAFEGMFMHWDEMAKRRSGRDREARRRIEAAKKGGVCGKCGKALKDGETAYAKYETYAGMGGGLMGKPGPRFEKVTACKGCAPEWMTEPKAYNEYTIGDRRVRIPASQRVDERPCSTCERPVVFKMTRRDYQGRPVFCCYRCEYTYQNHKRSERDQHLRQKVCEVCSKEFTATRAHTKTCSAACKQRAYRERRKAAASTNA
jgi:hypothetical protein